MPTKNIPLVIGIAIILGLGTYIFSVKMLYQALRNTSYAQEATEKKPQLILQENKKIDTLAVTTKQLKSIIPLTSWAVTNHSNTSTNLNQALYLNRYPGVLKWIVFHSIALSIGVTAIPFLLLLMASIKRDFRIHFLSKNSILSWLLVLSAAGILVFVKLNLDNTRLMGGAELMEYFQIIFKNPIDTVGLLVSIFLGVGIFPLIGIMLINLAIAEGQNPKTAMTKEALSKGYKKLKDALNIFALATGLLVAASVVGTGIQRYMISEQVSQIKLLYPDTFIYAYGLSFTLILALFFIPTLLYLKYFRQQQNIAIKKDEKSGWWHMGQESIGDIKLIFSIILPLLGSIVEPFIENYL